MTFFGMIGFSQCSGAVCQALGGEFKGGREEEGREREIVRKKEKRGGGRERKREREKEGGRERERKRGIEHSMYVRD
jgi:hypothetical protein